MPEFPRATAMSPLDRAKANRQTLLEKATRLKQTILEIESEINDYDAYIRISERLSINDEGREPEAQQPASIPPEQAPDVPGSGAKSTSEADLTAPVGHPLRGRGLPSAAALVLHKERVAMSVAEITKYLILRGFQFAAKKPESSVGWALNRAAEHSLVRKTGTAQWVASFGGPASTAMRADLMAMPPECWDVIEPVQIVDNMADDDRSGRTKAGLALAKERGVRLGPPPRLTEEHRVLASRMYEEGKTIQAIADACGVSANGLFRRIKLWQEEGVFPPSRGRVPRGRAKPETAGSVVH